MEPQSRGRPESQSLINVRSKSVTQTIQSDRLSHVCAKLHPLGPVESKIDSGGAHAALVADHQRRDRFKIEGSPTFVLNEGRQKLYGNVGYRVIEANIRELLRTPTAGEMSWC